MYIINITYKIDLEVVEVYLQEHIKYLKNEYSKGNFIASGRKNPRTGGVILSKIESKAKLEGILKKDPFYVNNIADYDIIEFIPSMTSKGFECLV